jgi:hypothetical protein
VNGIPWGVELNEDEGEFFDDGGEVGFTEYQDVFLFSVGY